MNDEKLGVYVYCAQHVGPHVSGWCTVGNDQKLGLPAETREEAYEWCKYLKLPIHGNCPVCYESISDTMAPFCAGLHSAHQVKEAERRKYALRKYLHDRYLRHLMQHTTERVR